jgi:heme-degrading monooxygenase HmoA
VAHVRVWQFEPRPGREQEFAAAYASDGAWAQLFEQAEGFLGTTLLVPAEPGGPWLTIDRWESKLAFERFQGSLGEAYRSLDVALSELTAAEHFIGAFDERP